MSSAAPFGKWLPYFERLPEDGIEQAMVSALRKWPDEWRGIQWAIKVIYLSKRIEAFRSFSSDVHNILDQPAKEV